MVVCAAGAAGAWNLRDLQGGANAHLERLLETGVHHDRANRAGDDRLGSVPGLRSGSHYPALAGGLSTSRQAVRGATQRDLFTFGLSGGRGLGPGSRTTIKI